VTAVRKRAPAVVVGRATARVAPPLPARSLWREFHDHASAIGIELYPWQDSVGRYLYALGRGDAWLYPEVAAIVGRQNGKTEMLVPHISKRLLMGRRIMHTAQNRELPREVFGRVADYIEREHPSLLPTRRGRTIAPRFANGQEEIRLTNGGAYRIVAPTRGGARGPAIDDLIVDEVRELVDHDFIAAAEPTQAASPNPQTLFLSSAGDESGVVLNAIKVRGGNDPALAYLEWSAAPHRAANDIEGWLESNPGTGHIPGKLDYLARKFESHRLAGTLAIFETEYLCRWVVTLREPFVDGFSWAECEGSIPAETRPYMAVSMDPSGRRASAALAWRAPDESIALRLLLDVTGSPIDTDRLGSDLRDLAKTHRAVTTGYDPLTDRELAKFLRTPKPITGQEFANGSARFALAVANQRLRWHDAAAVTDDLVWTTRKPHDESGSYQAVRANDDRPITAALASIRAVWLASNPPTSEARIY
jgi:hypothetical protein